MKRHGIGAARAAYLADLYGTRAEDVLAFCLGRDDDEPLDGDCPTTAAEILFLVRNEFVVRLEDVLMRRTPLVIRGDVSTAIVDRVADTEPELLADCPLGTPPWAAMMARASVK